MKTFVLAAIFFVTTSICLCFSHSITPALYLTIGYIVGAASIIFVNKYIY